MNTLSHKLLFVAVVLSAGLVTCAARRKLELPPIIEAIARDGDAAINIPILPDDSLNADSVKMLKEVGVWMRRNGEAVYGSRAWTIPGEGEILNGKLKMLPGALCRGERFHTARRQNRNEFGT